MRYNTNATRAYGNLLALQSHVSCKESDERSDFSSDEQFANKAESPSAS